MQNSNPPGPQLTPYFNQNLSPPVATPNSVLKSPPSTTNQSLISNTQLPIPSSQNCLTNQTLPNANQSPAQANQNSMLNLYTAGANLAMEPLTPYLPVPEYASPALPGNFVGRLGYYGKFFGVSEFGKEEFFNWENFWKKENAENFCLSDSFNVSLNFSFLTYSETKNDEISSSIRIASDNFPLSKLKSLS